MIYDDISKISEYKIPEHIVNFIQSLSPDIETGRHELDAGAYANIDEYYTKRIEDCRMEAHKKYIDVQIMLKGEERLDFVDSESLHIREEYDKLRDVMFFCAPDEINSVKLIPGKFVMLYPHEAHRPQMAIDNTPEAVKKVVVKIPVN